MIEKADVNGCPQVGLFGIANKDYAVVSAMSPPSFQDLVGKVLEVDVVPATVDETGLIGLFCAANSRKVFLPGTVLPEEKKVFEDVFQEVIVVEGRYTALGNLIAMNDKGVIVSRYLAESIPEGVVMSVAGSDLVGSVLYANNKGFLVHPGSNDSEIREIEKVLGVQGDVGTVNFGDQFVRSGILGNDKGLLVGSATTGPEIMRVYDVFG